MKALLRILSGANEKGVIDLEIGTYTIGRDEDAEIKIDSRQVSRKHAQIIVSEHHVRLVDCGSANGTLVNGKPFQSGPLYEGDQIQVGDVTFEYEPKRAMQLFTSNASPGDAYTVRKTTTRRTVGKETKPTLSVQLILTTALSFLLIGFTLISGSLFRSALIHRLEKDALQKGSDLVRYLAEKNREDIRVGNTLLIDLESVKKEKGVKEAVLVNSSGKVIAPINQIGQTENDPFTAEALSQNSDRNILPSPPFSDGTRIYVHPIRAYNDKVGTYETIGAAKIIFSPAEHMGSLHQFNLVLFGMLIFSVLLSAFTAWGMIWMFNRQTKFPLLAQVVALIKEKKV